MKKRYFLMTLLLVLGLLGGCGQERTESIDIIAENINSEGISTEEVASKGEEPSGAEDNVIESSESDGNQEGENKVSENGGNQEGENKDIETNGSQEDENKDSENKGNEVDKTGGNEDYEWNEKIEIDYDYDYSEDIKADVEYVVSSSTSLQEELENIEKIIQKYTPIVQSAQTQMEMNISSRWLWVIWDTELNNLWSRFSDLADPQTKEKLLAEQRNWIAMKEEVMLMNLGTREENGSMYPMLQNAFLEEITEDRAYIIANQLAKIMGENFVMPERSEKYGLFVDNQGTGSVYSSLITGPGWEGDEEAIISIYRQGQTEGTFVDNGNGELAYTSDDGSVKGIIQINGWDGASFKVTETPEQSIFAVGEEFEFPFVF